MRQRIIFKVFLAGATSAAALLCFAAKNAPSLALVLIASAAVITLCPFGRAPSSRQLDKLTADLSDVRGGVETAPRTSGLVSDTLIAIPAARGNSLTSLRFALLFRDEITSVKWRSLATWLRMQRNKKRAP